MDNMFEALKNAGFVAQDNGFEEYEKFSDVRLPFGSTTNEKDSPFMSEFEAGILKSINYIRKTAKSITKEELVDMCPSIKKDDKNLKFLLDNIDKVRLVNTGGFRKVSEGYLGNHTEEYSYEMDTQYGLTDVAILFTFNTQIMQVTARCDLSRLNYNYQKDIRKKMSQLAGGSECENISDERVFMILNEFMSQLEFIPFTVSEYDGVRISHGAYRNKYGRKIDEFTSPALGINIKKDKNVMDGLSGFLANGAVIKDDVFYLILKDRHDKDSLYLKRYLEWSPKNK